MLTIGIPKGINCSFIDNQGNDLVKDIVENNSEIFLEENSIGNIVKSDYYSLKLRINDAMIPTEMLEITNHVGSNVINPITGMEVGYTVYLSWDNLFTDDLLKSKWRDFNIEYYIIFPKMFKDNKEHILKCIIKRGSNGSPLITNVSFDGLSIEYSNLANFCFITLD